MGAQPMARKSTRYRTTAVSAAVVNDVLHLRAPAATASANPPKHDRDRGQMEEHPRARCSRWCIELRRGEHPQPQARARGHEQDGRDDGAGRKQQRSRHDDPPGQGSGQHEIHKAGLDLVRRLCREVDRQHRHQHDDDRMKVAEGHRALEGDEQHRLAAESALQEGRHELRHAAKRVRLLQRRRLTDDDHLKDGQEGETTEQHVPSLHD